METAAPQYDPRAKQVARAMTPPTLRGAVDRRTLHDAIERVTELNSRLVMLGDRIESHASRIAGERPAAETSAPSVDSPNGQLSMLHSALDAAFALLDRAAAGVTRFEEV